MIVRDRDRRGRFSLPMEILAEMTEEELALVFGQVRIYRADTDVCVGAVIYDGTSPLFREVKDGEEAPWYRFLLTLREEGLVTVDVLEVTEPVWVHHLPVGYGSGVVTIPAGLRLVDRETGEEVGHG